MSRVSRSDVHAVLELVRELEGVPELAQFPTRMLAGLMKLIPSDVLCYDELGRNGERLARTHRPVDAVPEPEEEACQRLAHHNPLVTHYVRTGGGPPLRVSDFLGQRKFRSLDVYQDCYRALGWEYQMIAILPSASGLRGVTFNRKARDYAERDRALAELARHHLAHAFQTVHARARMWNRLTMLERAVEADDHAIVLVAADRRITLATPRAALWLASYSKHPVGEGKRLPPILDDLVRRERSLRNTEPLKVAGGPLVLERHEPRLQVRFLPSSEIGGDDALVLQEIVNRPRSGDVRLDGLTKREAKVLELVARGMTNREIAELLFMSDRTVQKHLEHVYDKLDVHTRTAAVRRLTQE